MMKYNDLKLGERISYYFEKGFINEYIYTDIMNYLSMNIFTDMFNVFKTLIEIYNKLGKNINKSNYYYLEILQKMQTLLLIDIIYKFSDIITLNFTKTIGNYKIFGSKKFIKVVIDKIEHVEDNIEYVNISLDYNKINTICSYYNTMV